MWNRHAYLSAPIGESEGYSAIVMLWLRMNIQQVSLQIETPVKKLPYWRVTIGTRFYCQKIMDNSK